MSTPRDLEDALGAQRTWEICAFRAAVAEQHYRELQEQRRRIWFEHDKWMHVERSPLIEKGICGDNVLQGNEEAIFSTGTKTGRWTSAMTAPYGGHGGTIPPGRGARGSDLRIGGKNPLFGAIEAAKKKRARRLLLLL